MAWIESHQSMKEHRKTKELKKLLRLSTIQVVGHLHLLWWWSLDNAPDGDLSGISHDIIAEVMEWRGDPEKLFDALLTAGWLDQDGTIHDWAAYAGKLVDKRKDNALKQKAYRERKNQERYHDVTTTLPLRDGATVPNRTQPYHNVLPDGNTTLTDATAKKKEKQSFGEFGNVMLTEEEKGKLVEKLGAAKSADLIEQLSIYMRQSPANAKKYKDHYATILNWARRDDRKPKQHVGDDGWPRV